MEDLKITTVEMHTGGEPLRIVESGYPKIMGKNILEKRKYVKEKLDYLRKFLIFEPRGHYDMYGAIKVDPDVEEANAAFLFMHNEGYSTMCGHAVIALGRYCVDNKIVEYNEPETLVNLQVPCGLIKAYVNCSHGISQSVRFHSVPSFVFASEVKVSMPNCQILTVDICYGGAFYAILPLGHVGLNIDSPINVIKKVATEIKAALTMQVSIVHPDADDLGYLYGVIFTESENSDCAFNLTVFADMQVDRSPCGSGTTARVALLHANEQIGFNEFKEFQNPLTKSKFTARVVKKASCGEMNAVIVEIEGNAHYTGTATFTAEKDDTLREGIIIA